MNLTVLGVIEALSDPEFRVNIFPKRIYAIDVTMMQVEDWVEAGRFISTLIVQIRLSETLRVVPPLTI